MTSQAARFVRLFLFAIAPALLAIATGQSHLTVAAVEAAGVGALEVAWRGIAPTTPAAIPAPPAPTSSASSIPPAPPAAPPAA